jgi:sugar lactone lactonase YvrE
MSMDVDLLLRVEAEVGESPVWDPSRHCLWWVDLLKGHLHRLHLDGTDSVIASLGKGLGFVALTESEDLIAGTVDSLGTIDLAAGAYCPKLILESDRSGYRTNDGKCDPIGRLWLGTMSDERWGHGRWYRLLPGWRLAQWRDDFDVPNGLCWSPDGRTLYLADSGRRVIEVWSYDLDEGEPRSLVGRVDLSQEQGRPDGMTVDEEGCIWVALWGGSAVCRFRPDGRLDRSLNLPVTLVASCEFGGPRLDHLFVTTARYQMNAEQLLNEPLAGSIFVCRPGQYGLPATRFLATRQT